MAKQIPLKIEKIKLNGKSTDFSYRDTIKTVLSTPGTSGFSTEDVILSMKIAHKLDPSNGSKVKDNITLEDTEWKHLRDLIADFRWGVAHDGIVNLQESVNNAKNVEI